MTRYTKKDIPISKDSIYKKKWRRLFAPTQLKTQGQWLCCKLRAVEDLRLDSLVVFGYTSLASLAVLTAKWCPNHAIDAEMQIIKLP